MAIDVVERRVAVGIRPEHLRRMPQGTQDGIAAMVDYVEELGASRLVHAISNGTRLVAVDSADDHPVTGETVNFAFDPANLHVFSSEDGHRITPGVGMFGRPTQRPEPRRERPGDGQGSGQAGMPA